MTEFHSLHGGGMDMGMDNSTTAMSMMTAFSTSLGTANLWFDAWTPTSSAATLGACIGLFWLAVLSRLLVVLKTLAEAGWRDHLNLVRQQRRRHQEQQHRDRKIQKQGLNRSGNEGMSTSIESLSSGSHSSTNTNTNSNGHRGGDDDDGGRNLSNDDVSSTKEIKQLAAVGGQTGLRSHHHLLLQGLKNENYTLPPFIPSIDIPRSLLFTFQSFLNYMLMLAIMTFNAWFFIAVLLGLGLGELSVGRFVQGLNTQNNHRAGGVGGGGGGVAYYDEARF